MTPADLTPKPTADGFILCMMCPPPPRVTYNKIGVGLLLPKLDLPNSYEDDFSSDDDKENLFLPCLPSRGSGAMPLIRLQPRTSKYRPQTGHANAAGSEKGIMYSLTRRPANATSGGKGLYSLTPRSSLQRGGRVNAAATTNNLINRNPSFQRPANASAKGACSLTPRSSFQRVGPVNAAATANHLINRNTSLQRGPANANATWGGRGVYSLTPSSSSQRVNAAAANHLINRNASFQRPANANATWGGKRVSPRSSPHRVSTTATGKLFSLKRSTSFQPFPANAPKTAGYSLTRSNSYQQAAYNLSRSASKPTLLERIPSFSSRAA